MTRSGFRKPPPMSEKQGKFINSLIDQLGYKDSPHREYFVNRIRLADADIEYASKLIEGFLKEIKKRKYPREWVEVTVLSTIQDLTQFVFCPASYSIKKSFRLETDGEDKSNDDETNDQPDSYLLELISYLGTITTDSRNNFFTDNAIIKEIFNSKLFYNGYLNDKASYNVAYNLAGKPHLIFKNSLGEKILIVEKTTFEDNLPKLAWHNHEVQVWAYTYLFPKFNISKAYIIYWERGSISSPLRYKFKEFEIVVSEKEEHKLLPILDSFEKLISKQNIIFDENSINPEKCFKCSCRTICNHKSGLISDLLFPYTTDEYYKKYPHYYTWSETQSLAEMADEEMYEISDMITIIDHIHNEDLSRRKKYILEELLSLSYPSEKEYIGEITEVKPSDIKISRFGDKYIELSSASVNVEVIKTSYKIYTLTFERANGEQEYIVIGE